MPKASRWSRWTIFCPFDVFGAIGTVVLHIVPLNRKLFAQRWHLTKGEEFRDAEHLLKTARVVAWHHQQVLLDLVVLAWGQIDVLDVSGRLTIEDSADKNAHGLMKAGFVFFNDGGLIGEEVVSHDLAPGSFVAALENILELGESLAPVQSSLVAAWMKSGRVFS